MDQRDSSVIADRIEAATKRILEEHFKLGFAQIVAVYAANGDDIDTATRRATAVLQHVRDRYSGVNRGPLG